MSYNSDFSSAETWGYNGSQEYLDQLRKSTASKIVTSGCHLDLLIGSQVKYANVLDELIGGSCTGKSNLFYPPEEDESEADRILRVEMAKNICRLCRVYDRCKEKAANDFYTGVDCSQDPLPPGQVIAGMDSSGLYEHKKHLQSPRSSML